MLAEIDSVNDGTTFFIKATLPRMESRQKTVAASVSEPLLFLLLLFNNLN